MDRSITVTRIADRTYRVEHDGGNEIVYVTGLAADRWVFWNGHVFRGDFRVNGSVRSGAPRTASAQALSAPMPARGIRILASPGGIGRKGDTLVLLEAM